MAEDQNFFGILGACAWCPYKDLLSLEVNPENLDGLTAQYDEIQQKKCDSVKDGQCKVAQFALTELIESKD